MSAPQVAPVAVLVGPPGAGKSTVGRLLARRLGLAFRDTDLDIEVAAGRTVAEIFLDEGEDGFRRRERQAVQAALSEHGGVLALGGGAVLDSGTRTLLAGHRVVYLRVDSHHAARRVGLARDRPVLALNPRAMLTALMKERAPLYAEVAVVEVDTVGLSPEDVADQLVRQLAETA